MRVGVTTLGDHMADPKTGEKLSTGERFRQFVELGVQAEQLGFDSFHIGEHHFCEYVVSSPTPVLAAVAERTSRLRLSTAVSLLPHHDPVRIAEDYATVDQLSGGRVELIAGRGVWPALYQQYGQDEADGPDLLVESVELLRRLWTEEAVSWNGRLRPALDAVTVHPRPRQSPHPPIWVSASSEESVDRAIRLGCPIMIPTVSTGVKRPPMLAARYRQGWAAAGRAPGDAAVGLHVHCYVGPSSSEQAVEFWRPHHEAYLAWVLSIVRPGIGVPAPMLAVGTPDASPACGNAGDVAAELQRRIDAIGGIDVLLVQTDQGGLAWDDVIASLQRLHDDVLPAITNGG
jgi:alkanesulfonate monooxygenase SsuD/methylene tetrahydromethanopterin reductase-like flavin-dependent oxidoreductase (luciferase family)